MLRTFLLLSGMCSLAHGFTFPGQADQVLSLPGLNFTLNYRHYSGYLGSIKDTRVHYWFFESQSGPHNATDPVVVWLNGGPGCSSLFGETIELGPIQYNETTGAIQPNPYAWNKKVNLLFLESPSGVGFTYRPGQTNLATDDDETAQVNFGALQSFFAKFPHLTANDFYITGESYAGFYIPTLSMVVLDEKFPENFRGIAIGDGLLDWDLSPKFVARYREYRMENLKDEGAYLNRADVKAALHIDPTWSGQWQECNYDVLDSYAETKNHDMRSQLGRIVNDARLKTLIYQGEQDPLISWTGNKKFIDTELGLKNITDLHPWSFNGTEVGQTQLYEKNLTFTTFHGAGHMVPEDKPAPAYFMIYNFLVGPEIAEEPRIIRPRIGIPIRPLPPVRAGNLGTLG